MQFTHCSDYYKGGGPRWTKQGDSVLKDCSSQFERKQNSRKGQRKAKKKKKKVV